MDENKRITTILVDTCAFHKANSDFIGVNSMLLPSFFSAIEEKGICLLTHPILENEIEKHIEESRLYKDYQNLILQLKKCKDVLQYADCTDEKLFTKISQYDIKGQTFNAYKKYYRNAVKMDYPDPEHIFDLYFAARPPFALTGNKKYEFPDAFVIEAVKQYIEEHSNDVILIISDDNDWKDAFENWDRVILCNSIIESVKLINGIESILSEEIIEGIFHSVYGEIMSEAQTCVECECYELEGYECIDDLEIDSVEVQKIDESFIPLKISRDMIWIKSTVNIKVSGQGEILDEERSIWDSEDGDYIIEEYSDIEFIDGNAEVECEIKIIFDFDNPKDSAQVDSFKLNNRWNIGVNCDNITITPIDEDEMALRCLREDKGYSRKR